MQYIGDFAEDATVVFDFNVFDANGEPVALTGTLTEAVEIYKSGSTTPHTAKYTPAVLNSLTGVYRVEVDMSAHAFFAAGVNYAAILTGAGITADGVAVTNTVLRTWSCQNRTAIAPDGSLDADKFATGVLATDADIADAVWNEPRADHTDADSFGEGVNVYSLTTNAQGNVRTSVGLAAANLDTQLSTIDTVVDAIVVDTGTDLPASLSAIVADTNELQTDWANGGRLDLLLDQAATAASVPSAATIADAVLDEALSGHATAGTVGAALTDILADTAELQGDWANGGRLDLILDGVAAGGSAPTAAAIADAVWTEAIADHSGEAGSTAEALNNAGAAGTVSTAQVSNERTWFAEEYRSRNIVTVGNGFAGTFAVVPDINPETTIASVSSVAITGAASVTASSSAVRADKQAAHFTVPALTTSGTYTVVVKVITNDSQTIPTTCVLKVI